jgi:hypothetical protein
MPRNSWTVGRQNLVLIRTRDGYRIAQRNSLKESPSESVNKRIGGSSSTKLARMQAIMVDLSTKQPTGTNEGCLLSE